MSLLYMSVEVVYKISKEAYFQEEKLFCCLHYKQTGGLASDVVVILICLLLTIYYKFG